MVFSFSKKSVHMIKKDVKGNIIEIKKHTVKKPFNFFSKKVKLDLSDLSDVSDVSDVSDIEW